MQLLQYSAKSCRQHCTILLAAGIFVAGIAGCAGAHHAVGANATAATLSPDDAPLHPNRNAMYTMPVSAPRLVPRPTTEDAIRAKPCEERVLSVSEIASNVNGDRRSVKLAFMNRGAIACRLGGYPEIALMGSADDKVGSIAIEKSTTAAVLAEMSTSSTAKTIPAASEPTPELVLMPHSVAAFEVVWQFGPECPLISKIEVTAPETTKSFSISHPLKVCAGHIQITALQPDEGDS
jgi:hypothetical protein